MTKKFSNQDSELWKAVTADVVPLGHIREPSQTVNQQSKFWPDLAPVRNTVLDLHGLTVDAAYSAAQEFVDRATTSSPTIITGISGQIKREFEFWFNQHPSVRHVEPLNDGGAYRLHLKKRRRTK
jgi:dsDNA-specific endonuclease/ATPase MutS2